MTKNPPFLEKRGERVITCALFLLVRFNDNRRLFIRVGL